MRQRMSLTVARGILDDARKRGWTIRPSLHSSRILVAEKSTYASDVRRVYGWSEIDLAHLLLDRGSRIDRPRREREPRGGEA